MGLYGNIIVRPTDPDAYGPSNQEKFLILDDLMLDDKGRNVPYGEEDANFPLMGRFGNVMLVNGSSDPYTMEVSRGSVVRFYLTNVANTRTFRVVFQGAKMKLVGSDVGRYEQEEWIDAVTIAPAERYIVDVLFEEPGTYGIQHESPLKSYDLGSVTVLEQPTETSYAEDFRSLRRNQDVVKDIDAFRPFFDKPIDKTLKLWVETSMEHAGMEEQTDDGIEWEDTMPIMNEIMGAEDVQWKLIDEETELENMDMNWTFEKGSIAKVRIINDEESSHPMQHPIHFHGQRFLVLSMDGKKNENLVWKDTVLVPAGSTADLLFEISNPGDWMFHCHIAEHLTNGMMGMFRVVE